MGILSTHGIRVVRIKQKAFQEHGEKRSYSALLSMLRWVLQVYTLVFFCTSSFLLGAVQSTPALETPLELSALGLPIVHVILTDPYGSSRSVRMMVDTGASISVLDSSIPDVFWDSIGGISKGGTSTRDIVQARKGKIHDLKIGPIHLQELPVIRVDLSVSLSRLDDAPIDGIIGMDVLRGHRLQMDFTGQRIRWEVRSPANSVEIAPLHFNRFGNPLLVVTIGGKNVTVEVDTGSNEFLTLSPKDLNGVKILNKGMNSGVTSGLGSSTILQSTIEADGGVKLGARGWSSPDIICNMENTRQALLGTSAMGQSVWFDFVQNTLAFTVGKDGSLSTTPIKHFPIAVFWDRKPGSEPRLVVMAVKPGSPYEKAGLEPGDVLLQVGDLKGADLNIRTLGDCLNTRAPGLVVIERRGKRIELGSQPSAAN